MRMKEFTIDGKTIMFINSCSTSYSGFTHETQLFIDSWPEAEARCHYINRTWERYSYQSVMLEAVHKLQEKRIAELKQDFKCQIGCRNIMERHMQAFEAFLKNDETLAFYLKIEEALQ